MKTSTTSSPSVATGFGSTRSECQAKISVTLPIRNSSYELSKNLRSGLDWLTVVTSHRSHDDLQAMVDFVAEYLADTFVLEFGVPFSAGRGCKSYANSGSSVKGCQVGWNVEENGTSTCWLSIPGGAFRSIAPRDAWRMCCGLNQRWNAEARRFDAYIDDYLRRVASFQVLNACRSANVALVRSYAAFEKGLCGELPNPTIYLGSRESEKFVRFYDAERKHGTPCDRWEVELKRRHALEAFLRYTSLEFEPGAEDEFDEKASKFLAGLVVGAVDFVHRTDGERYSRCDRLPWWASLCDEVEESVRLSPARKAPSIERSLGWIKRQVALFMSCLRSGWGHDFFYRWLDAEFRAATPRYSAYHHAVIAQLKNEFEVEIIPEFAVVTLDE